jgi:hypothetical protein
MTAAHLLALRARIDACATAADADAVWQAEIGYSTLAENEGATRDQIVADLHDYVRELCYDLGVHVSEIYPD